MLVLRLLVMVLTIICLMDGHAEVSSSTTGIRDRRESPAVKTNEPEVQIHDRKKKKKPKPSKKKKTKPGKKKKPNKAKPIPTKPVTTTPTVSTSTLKTTKILTTPTITTTTTTVSPTTTATTAKTTTSTASATTTATTTTVATSSTASTATTTIPTTATTSSLPTTAATTADSGAGEECKATNGKPCIFPFKDGKEYNECKNEGGKYFWCATSVYDSGKYKHWSYCPEDRSCPLEGDGECRAENNKPCVFPFKDGVKEYNECADHGGQYFWCATGTNSAGKYTAWSKCPKDGSCPLPQKSSTPAITPTATAAITSPLTTGTTMPPMEKKVFSSLKDLVKEESKNDTFKMLQTMNEEMQAINEDLEGQRNIESDHGSGGNATIFKKHSVGDEQDRDLIELRSYGENSEFTWSTFTYKGPTYLMGESNCCSACKKKWSDTEFFEYWAYFKKCWCYKKGSYGEPWIKYHNSISTGQCENTCDKTRDGDWTLKCPYGYQSAGDAAPSLYTLKDWEKISSQECAINCKKMDGCSALIYTSPCGKCKLLTDYKQSIAEEKKYCLDSSQPAMCAETRRSSTDDCPNGYAFETLYPIVNNINPDNLIVKQIMVRSVDECTGICDTFWPRHKCLGVQIRACTNVPRYCMLILNAPTNTDLGANPITMDYGPQSHLRWLECYKGPLLVYPNVAVNGNQIASFTDNQLIFLRLKNYAETCHNKQTVYTTQQIAFIAWAPQYMNTQQKMAYIQQNFAPPAGRAICQPNYAKALGGWNPHPEELIMTYALNTMRNYQPMDVFLYSYNSPCAGHDLMKDGTVRGCVHAIFNYALGTPNHLNMKHPTWMVNYPNNGAGYNWNAAGIQNFRAYGHTMNVGFFDWYVGRDGTCPEVRRWFCDQVDLEKRSVPYNAIPHISRWLKFTKLNQLQYQTNTRYCDATDSVWSRLTC